ncbi:MAG: preprotein translocase subunit SecA [Acidimicrobiia bacterium]|nr:preprotein translocase subunit SecA [Acidimicrobiia bacterium]
MSMFKKVLRSGEGKKIRALEAIVPDINALEPEIQALSDDALQGKTVEFRTRLDNGETLDDILVEAFAVVREASIRTLGMRHYDVQLMGGLSLHLGWVAEMRTGEGKTLVSTLPVYLNGLTGKGLHVVTVNDYLASRDAEMMGKLHNWLGITVGLVIPGNRDSTFKRAQYAADVTYGTNNEFGFDYLRDNMAMTAAARVQRGHEFCIVDEIDSILIDEARTPLIISGRVADAAQIYYKFASIARSLERDVDYDVDEEKRIVAPTEDGIHAVEGALGIDNLYDPASANANLVHQLLASLKAKELYKRDKEYLVDGGEVKIVDEFTGRVLEGRRWSDGLHQAVEAKEGVKIKEENQTLATITLQNYYRQYEKLAGMTGTAQTEAAELAGTYGLQVVQIPTNEPVIREDMADLIFKTEDGKFNAVADDIAERTAVGQPVLVGTVSVEKSEKLSRLLEKRGIKHTVLNAKQHTSEGQVVAQAGRLHGVTVATNMAGRGVDILLGGNPEGLAERDARGEQLEPGAEEFEERYADLLAKHTAQCEEEGARVRELGGLYVLGTERHESRRIDNQLRGRAGRQGDQGKSRFYLSLEDDLMRLFATGAMNYVMDRALPDDVPIEAKMVSKAIERAQNTVEAKNAEVRKNVLKYDEVMNEQRKVIYQRRRQILEGEDLREKSIEAITEVVDSLISTHAGAEHPEEWDVDALATEVGSYWPTTLDADRLAEEPSGAVLYETLAGDAIERYEEREGVVGEETMRQVERQIMLRLIDQRWREHLYEMDYLREGIHLRAMGQKDPATEWQREGFEMFGHMISAIDSEYVRYIMHVEVKENDGEADAAAAKSNIVDATAQKAQAAPTTGTPTASGATAGPAAGLGSDLTTNESTSAQDAAKVEKSAPLPKQNTEFENVGRNAPCPCGSGKKFKHCHGR